MSLFTSHAGFGLGLLLLLSSMAEAGSRAKYFVVVVWDGMRPDYVSAELTPTLYRLREEGVWFANHHSVFPTSTEVNGAVLATGVFPEHSHITANKEYRREIDLLGPFGTEALKAVRAGDAETGDRFLAVPTLAERVQAGKLNTAVVGAKPIALLHDRQPRPDESRNPVWFVEGCLPPS